MVMLEFTELRPVVDTLKSHLGQDLRSVILFGSRARQQASGTSDYDVLIVADNLPQEPIARLRKIRLALAEVLIPVNTVTKTPEEMDRQLTPLLLDVCVDGQCLYGEDFFEPRRAKALAALKASGLKRKRRGKTSSWAFDKPADREWSLDWEGFRELAR